MDGKSIDPDGLFPRRGFHIYQISWFCWEAFLTPQICNKKSFRVGGMLQVTLVDNVYVVERNKIKIYVFPLIISNSQVTLIKWKVEGELTNLLVVLGLVLIYDK